MSNSFQAKLGLCCADVRICTVLHLFEAILRGLWERYRTLFICFEALCFWELRTAEWHVEPWIGLSFDFILFIYSTDMHRHHSRTPCGSAHAALLVVMVLAAALSAAPWLRPARTRPLETLGHSTWHRRVSLSLKWKHAEWRRRPLTCTSIASTNRRQADIVRAKLCRIHHPNRKTLEHSNNDSFAMGDSWPFNSFDTELGPFGGAVSSRVRDHRVHGSDSSRCCHLTDFVTIKDANSIFRCFRG